MSLLRLIREHEGATDADLLRYYGVDYMDAGTPRMPWRRLRDLIRHLPRDSSTARAVHGDEAEWGYGEHLLASIFDVLQLANWQRGDGKNDRPKPLPRPGGSGRRIGRTNKSPREVARYLARFQPQRD